MLLRHCTCFAFSRARFRLGSRMLISSAMMPMTTSSSTSVKPPLDGMVERAGRVWTGRGTETVDP